jgi:hypothetical protein
LCLIPVISISCFQKFEINNLLQSEIISSGRPFLQHQFSKKRIAQSSAVRVVCVGMMHTSEWSRSVIINIQSKPLSIGKGPMKSIKIESPQSSGTGRGCRGPVGLDVELLFHMHSVQEEMYLYSKSLRMPGQKKEFQMLSYVLKKPKWPEESYARWKMHSRTLFPAGIIRQSPINQRPSLNVRFHRLLEAERSFAHQGSDK